VVIYWSYDTFFIKKSISHRVNESRRK